MTDCALGNLLKMFAGADLEVSKFREAQANLIIKSGPRCLTGDHVTYA